MIEPLTDVVTITIAGVPVESREPSIKEIKDKLNELIEAHNKEERTMKVEENDQTTRWDLTSFGIGDQYRVVVPKDMYEIVTEDEDYYYLGHTDNT